MISRFLGFVLASMAVQAHAQADGAAPEPPTPEACAAHQQETLRQIQARRWSVRHDLRGSAKCAAIAEGAGHQSVALIKLGLDRAIELRPQIYASLCMRGWVPSEDRYEQSMSQKLQAFGQITREYDRLTEEHGACVKAEQEAAEAQRAAAAQAEAQRAEALRQDSSNPKILTALYSAEICWYQRDRKESLDAIAKEKKYARIGGVVDRKALYDWTGDIRRADEKIPPLQQRLRELKAKPLPCSEKAIAALSSCFNPLLGGVMESLPDHCEQAPFGGYLEVARTLIDE